MQRTSVLIGLAGGSGSGKTSLIRALRAHLPLGTVSVVSQDDYYHPKEAQTMDANGRLNFDLPSAVDLDALARDLGLLRMGRPIAREEYTFNQAGREPRWIEVAPAPVVLVEGLFILHHAAVREQFHSKVYVEAPEHVQLERRLRRDARERGYGRNEVLYQWEHHVMPAYRDHLLPYKHLCDLCVHNDGALDAATHQLLDHVREITEPVQSGAASL